MIFEPLAVLSLDELDVYIEIVVVVVVVVGVLSAALAAHVFALTHGVLGQLELVVARLLLIVVLLLQRVEKLHLASPHLLLLKLQLPLHRLSQVAIFIDLFILFIYSFIPELDNAKTIT